MSRPVSPARGELRHLQRQAAIRIGGLELLPDLPEQSRHVQRCRRQLRPAQPGEVQEVVDELAHHPDVVPDDVELADDFGIEFIGVLREDHPAVPVDGPERGAQVVGNGIAETLQFPVGGLELPRSLLQGFLRLLDLGDVPDGHGAADDLPLGVEDGRGAVEDEGVGAVEPLDLHQLIPDGLLRSAPPGPRPIPRAGRVRPYRPTMPCRPCSPRRNPSPAAARPRPLRRRGWT